MSADQLVRQAVALHAQGRLNEALPLYQRALAADPNHVEALTLAGGALTQAGQIETALQLLQRAVQLKPNSPQAFAHLGAAWRRAGRPANATAAFERALSLDAKLADAHLGYANLLLETGKAEQALSHFDAALAQQPRNALAHCNRGAALQMLKRHDDALAAFDRAVAAAPSMPEAHANRGNTLRELGRAEEALASCDKALASRPAYLGAMIFRGYALLELNRNDDALQAFQVAQQTNAADSRGAIGVGRALLAQGKSEEAIASLDAALARAPNDASGSFYRAAALAQLHRRDEALADVSRALSLDPAIKGAHHLRANLLTQAGDLESAMRDYAREFELNPSGAEVAGNLLHAKAMLCDWDGRDDLASRIVARTEAGERAAYPFVMLALTDAPALQRTAAEAYGQSLRPAPISTPLKARDPSSRIKLGYFSSDFSDHPVAHLMMAPFAAHDRAVFEVCAYAIGARADEYTDRVRQAVDQFVDCRAMTPEQIAARARADGIDIAIDLNGYSNGARTAIFAARAAPVQMNYIGYVGTMGAAFADYIIVDKHLVPPEHRSAYAERLLHLPVYQCNTEPEPSAPAEERALHGLPADGFVFASFNSPFKITPELFAVWMRILKRAPGSVLWLYAPNAVARRNLAAEAERQGVGADRIVFTGGAERSAHLARQRAADLMLDTFPYNGGVTTSSALRAGVPVLTLAGRAFASRMGVSLLNAVGIPELITETPDAYEELAVALALDSARAASLRARVQAGGDGRLFDAEKFTRSLEAGFVAALDRHRAEAGGDIVIS
jgi:predicted O-linked N-acetylglucosamine transferase (SPINDLY family)